MPILNDLLVCEEAELENMIPGNFGISYSKWHDGLNHNIVKITAFVNHVPVYYTSGDHTSLRECYANLIAFMLDEKIISSPN